MKFDRCLAIAAVRPSMKFQSAMTILIPDLVALRFHEIWWLNVLLCDLSPRNLSYILIVTPYGMQFYEKSWSSLVYVMDCCVANMKPLPNQ